MNTRIAISSLRARTTTVAPYDFPMEVQYEYDEGEAPIFWPTEQAHPGSPPNAILLSCKVGGVEIYEMLSSSQIERIEEAILDEMP
jgi:hypothetical protein